MAGPAAPEPHRGQSRRVSLSAIAIGLWVMLVAVLAYVWLRPSSPQGATQTLALMVSHRLSDLNVNPKRVQLPTDLSLEEAMAIRRGDYGQANRIAEGVLAQSTLEGWSFQPFNDFMENVVRYEDTSLLRHLNDWITRNPNSAIAHLLRGVYYEKIGWITRGSDYASAVTDYQMGLFHRDMADAISDIRTAINLKPNLPWSHFELMQVVSSGGNPAEAEEIFQTAIKTFPGYYPLYRERLVELSPKWYGSVDGMYQFVDQYARQAPSDSPLKLLYLQLYVNLLETAGAACDSIQGDAKQSCVGSGMNRMTQPDLLPGMLQALKLYGTSDPAQFTRAVWPLLGEMTCNRCYGSPAAISGVLQTLASIMGSDTQMMDKPTHNSYMLDDITARVWSQIGNTSNADQKFQEALKDVGRTPFKDEAQKAIALATIFDDMAQFADDTSQFIDMIVYQEAENEVGGSNFSNAPYRACYAYYRMKYFDEAVKECSALIDGTGNYLQTHYWRAKAYERLRRWDASIADFSPVAVVGDNWFRVGAALDMSYDFGQKGDYAGQLASMNKYAYLFDPNVQPPHDLAVAYNNRCTAYMHVGLLQKALDDCTTSLKYDRIPDALHKEQELLRRIGNHAPPPGREVVPNTNKPAAIRPT